MNTINSWISGLIAMHRAHQPHPTLLAVCPNSAAVLEAAVRVAAANNTPMLFAATLNQVDLDCGYTGWTPQEFVRSLHDFSGQYDWHGPVYPCLDHGGPWLKDQHTIQNLTYAETMAAVKDSITACLEAGYQLLHMDPTVDRSLPLDQSPDLDTVVSRTVELIEHAEAERTHRNLPSVAYEVGTEEVHGGLVELDHLDKFLRKLESALRAAGLMHAWPAFIVAQVGTDLHTTRFDSSAARQVFEIAASFGSLAKGHYTDWVVNPTKYPRTGMGGANVGPEFTAEEFQALSDLALKEQCLCASRSWAEPSGFMQVLEDAVMQSARWKKWLQPGERDLEFYALSSNRRRWLAKTGARYVWTHPAVTAAREKLYANLATVIEDPHDYVVSRIARSIDRYVVAFNLFDALTLLEKA